MASIKNKIIVITGASSGIGQATARLAAKEGAIPVLLARSAEALHALAAELKKSAPETSFYPMDVTDNNQIVDTVSAILAKYGRIDIWINNAGYGIFSPFTEASFADIEGMMNVNYFGVVRCTKAVLPHMLAQGSGHIITVASVAGKLATPKSSGYAASKFAVTGFMQSLHEEVKGSGVFVSTVNPGPVQTPFFEQADPDGSYRRSVERFMVTPEAVARAILLLYQTKKAEATIPRYMNIGVILSHAFPAFFNRMIRPRLNKK
ncbi:SDR family oxidoreductase [Aneurinibacillus sp. BA2021]|nr:SDR family oxidoreductase [Aneurinibacillus sp. BA2021]